MIWVAIASLAVLYLVVVWMLRNDPAPPDMTEWRKAAEGRVRVIEKKYME